MPDRNPIITRLGPVNASGENDNWLPAIYSDGEEFTEMVFLPTEVSFEPNQKAIISTDKAGVLEVQVKQKHSTPGVRLRRLIDLEPGDYELEIIGSSLVENTFFPFVIDNQTNERITPTFHVSSEFQSISVPFSVLEASKFIFIYFNFFLWRLINLSTFNLLKVLFSSKETFFIE